MRGRRRKKNVSQLPALTFVNSPLFQPTPAVVPEAVAADNPITAREVPVEDNLQNSWVSPQFSRASAWRDKTRLRKRSLRLRHKSDDDRVVRSRFVPLQFMCGSDSKQEAVVGDGRCLCRVGLLGTCKDNCHGEHQYEAECPILPPVVQNGCREETERSRDVSPKVKPLGRASLDHESPSMKNSKKHSHSQTPVLSQKDPQENDIRKGMFTPQKDFVDSESLLRTPPRHLEEILAFDTPECDYNLTLRQRYLKYGFPHTMARSLSMS